ncbi:hypothetical protein F5X99DRAFT_431561 [Biscogniauxia marginata]|nr:hypothetical protein F5X99DRAFT_431561 [Biscogniauxia marginata]
MRLSTSIHLILAATTVSASAHHALVGRILASAPELVARKGECHEDEQEIFRLGSRFICVGKKYVTTGQELAGWTLKTLGDAIVDEAASRFAKWVVDKTINTVSSTFGRRESSGAFDGLEIWDEDDETVTYCWSPRAASMSSRAAADSDELDFSALIHNMTAQYNKASGRLTQADMTFDGAFDSAESAVGKRDANQVTITYYALKGHESTKLSQADLTTLYQQVFDRADDRVCAECGYAANSGTWHGAFKVVVSGCYPLSDNDCAPDREF